VVRERTSVLLPTPAVARRTTALVRRWGADVVVFGAAFPLGLMGPALRRRTGVPYVAFTHGLEVSAVRVPGLGRLLLRRVGNGAAAVTYVSRWCESLLRPAFGPTPRAQLLPPGVDAAEFHGDVDGGPIRRRHGLGDAPVVVCVSRMVARKGQDRLIEALPALRERVPAARLLLVGDGPDRSRLEHLARTTGVADHVTFTGQVADGELAAHFAAGDVAALPCRERRGGLEVEAFGIVVIQAQAVGVPVVAGDIGGVPDAVGGSDTGVLVDGDDVAAVTGAVGDLLADAPRRRAMGDAGSARVAAGFTWDRRVAELRSLLAEIRAC
jgi:phosphatidyl-myo-inositol dimannoside synthase